MADPMIEAVFAGVKISDRILDFCRKAARDQRGGRMAFTLRCGADGQKRLQGFAHWQYVEYNNAIDTSSSSRDIGDTLRARGHR